LSGFVDDFGPLVSRLSAECRTGQNDRFASFWLTHIIAYDTYLRAMSRELKQLDDVELGKRQHAAAKAFYETVTESMERTRGSNLFTLGPDGEIANREVRGIYRGLLSLISPDARSAILHELPFLFSIPDRLDSMAESA